LFIRGLFSSGCGEDPFRIICLLRRCCPVTAGKERESSYRSGDQKSGSKQKNKRHGPDFNVCYTELFFPLFSYPGPLPGSSLFFRCFI
ncbi:MAG TPA: hypothetical protein DCP64_14820, partial [Sarcina sp.]|nr:hypothetical protein [Sarcina sp.]